MALSATRMRILLGQQTSIAQKVFAAVPIHDQWSSKQIAGELARTGTVRDFTIVEGCLNSLKKSSLIRELAPGQFQRNKVKEAKPESEPQYQTTKVIMASTPALVAPNQTPKGPIDMLGDFAASLRNFSKMANSMADDLEELAMAIEEKIDGNSEELGKLRALKEALGAFTK